MQFEVLDFRSKLLKGQLGPTLVTKKCVFVTFLLIPALPPLGQLRPSISDGKVCVCNVFAYSCSKN